MNLDLKKEIEKITKEMDSVMIYFYNNNCAPCISLRPKIKELIKYNFPKMTLKFIDSEQNPEIPISFNIYSNPTIIVFFEGKEYIRKSKFVSISELKESIERIYKIIFDDR